MKKKIMKPKGIFEIISGIVIILTLWIIQTMDIAGIIRADM